MTHPTTTRGRLALDLIVEMQNNMKPPYAEDKYLFEALVSARLQLAEAEHLKTLHMARCKADMETMVRYEKEIAALKEGREKRDSLCFVAGVKAVREIEGIYSMDGGPSQESLKFLSAFLSQKSEGK